MMDVMDKQRPIIDQMSRIQEQEYNIFKQYSKERTRENRNRIFEEYSYLAEILAKKYLNRGVDYQDLYQIASIGLINAIERFDVDRGTGLAVLPLLR